jgi:hypothetical protein
MRGSRQSSFLLAEPPRCGCGRSTPAILDSAWPPSYEERVRAGKKNGLAISAHPSERARFSPLGVPLMLVQLRPSGEHRPYLLEKFEQSRVRTPGAKDHLGCRSTSPSLTPTRRRTTLRRSAWRSRERVAGTWSCCEHRGLC